jgi:hypothetical protein
MIGVTDLIAGVFKPAAELIDNLHTSTDEKNKHKERLLDVQAAAMQKVFDYEAQALAGQQKIVQAEASSEHWLVASWRPITMLTFLGLAVGDTFGLFATPLRDEAWALLQLGIGGYVVGRSGEKIAKVFKNDSTN